MKIALCQMNVTPSKAENLGKAGDMLRAAADQGARIAILPEMFTVPYAAHLFAGAAESCPGGEACAMLAETAKQTGLLVVGGSVPERDGERLYNTCMAFSPDGQYMGKYRKAHLFDVNVPGRFRFMESDTIAPGEGYPMMLDGPMSTGAMICFDIRFPEWAQLAAEAGADLLALPASFAINTGQRHWELLLRVRALDNQLFLAAVSPARSKSSYGHSLVATPDGKVLHDCGEDEALAVVELDLSMLEELRQSIPVRKKRRSDLYAVQKTSVSSAP